MTLEQPEHLIASQDTPAVQTPVVPTPMTFMSSAPSNRPTMPDSHPSNLADAGIKQASGALKPSTEDTAAQPPSAPTTSETRLSGSGPDNATTAGTSPLRDVDPQIIEALRGKDRIYVLKLGELMESLINDERRHRTELTPATTYQRLLVHRCSAYYKLTPETDPMSKVIYVYSTTESRIPPLRISELVPPETTTAPAFKIMRRSSTDRRNKPPHQASSVTEDGDLSDLEPSETGSLGGRSNTTGGSTKKHMTIEEREAAYNEARSRIFMGFEEKEKAKEKDINSSSSSLSVTSGSTKNGGSSTGDADSSSSSPATESEWSGPGRRERRQHSGYASASSSTRSIRSSAYISNGSGSSRNSRAASPSSFQYPSLYEPTAPPAPLYDPAQHSAPAAPVYHPPYGYPYNQGQGQPNPPYMPYHGYYPPPYPPYSAPHPPQNPSDPSAPSSGEPYPPPPPPMPYGTPYMWPHPSQPTVQSPPMQPQPIPSQPPSNITHGMSPPPPGQSPYQPYMPPPPPHGYPYPVPGYYPGQPGHPMPPPPPPPPAHPPRMPGPQLYDPRAPNNGPGNGQVNGFRSGMSSNGVPPSNNSRPPPPRNGFNGPNSGHGPKPRNGTVQPTRAPWSYGPGIGSGGLVATGSQPNETVGPRLSNNNRRQSNMSISSANGRSASGDDVSSAASSASSSSRRAQTMNAGSQHPLPARPDWAINLIPHNSRNMSPISPPRSISGGSAQSNYSPRHPSHSNSPISLQSTDFPPLTTMQPSERRMPTGAWGNPSSRPIFSQSNNGINNEMNSRLDETGFERPPPKSAELYNPKTPKRTHLNAANTENDLAQDGPVKANGGAAGTTAALTEQVAALSLGNSAPATDGSAPATAPVSSTSVRMLSSQ